MMASRWIKWLGLLLALLTLAVRAAPLSAPAEDPEGARVIVRFKLTSSLMRIQAATGGERQGPQHAATMAGRTGLGLRDGHMLDTRTQVLHGDKSLSSTALAERLAAQPDVEFAYPDLRRHILALPNDPLFAASPSISPVVGQWYLQAPDATLVSAINAPAAWAVTTGSAAIVVADIDTGVRFEHPDLANKLLPGRNFFSASGASSGWSADAIDPGDYTSDGQCGSGQVATPSSWHGTQVMGLIGAQTDNGIGMASVGREVMLLPVRALGPCGGYDSDIVAGMLWAAGMSLPVGDPSVPNPGNVPKNPNPAKVINLSLGSSGSCNGVVYERFIPEIIAQGITVVAAAGNQEGLPVSVPANCPGVIAVAAVRHTGTKVGFSNVGPEVAIAAPGGNCVNLSGPCLYPLLTTTNAGATTAAGSTYSNSSNYSVGTSFATPLVAGTAALMLSANPGLTPVQVKSLLQGSVRAFPGTSSDPTVTQCHAPSAVAQDECFCTTSTCGAGLLDAGAAVSAAAFGATPTASVTPLTATVTAGDSLSFDGSKSSAPGERTLKYQWAITSGGAIASFSGPTTDPSVTVTTSAAGSFTVQLTVTDSAGAHDSRSASVTVTEQTVVVPPPSGGGGGAFSGYWLLGLALAITALARERWLALALARGGQRRG